MWVVWLVYLNGLIANDKVCFVRTARLVHDRGRRRSSREPHGSAGLRYPPADGDRRGGRDEAGVAHPTGTAGDTGRATALGPRLSGDPDLDAPGRRGPTTGRGEGGG